jgi:hypothetical protein
MENLIEENKELQQQILDLRNLLVDAKFACRSAIDHCDAAIDIADAIIDADEDIRIEAMSKNDFKLHMLEQINKNKLKNLKVKISNDIKTANLNSVYSAFDDDQLQLILDSDLCEEWKDEMNKEIDIEAGYKALGVFESDEREHKAAVKFMCDNYRNRKRRI